ncbi:hypothetical protein Y032_0097g2983 [Ancylostoma ceylanicum]|nr:hypothetical protein Y032_0097g2983 [Ancylostoma ceylanicum]
MQTHQQVLCAMSSLPELIICVFCLVFPIYPAGTTQEFPKCERKHLGEVEQVLFAGMLPRLADLIIEGLPKQNHPQYTCGMEKLAHKVVLGKSIANHYKITKHNGPDNIVFWRVVKEYWKYQLENMGKVKKFGCDFAESTKRVSGLTKTTNYTIACVFK